MRITNWQRDSCKPSGQVTEDDDAAACHVDLEDGRRVLQSHGHPSSASEQPVQQLGGRRGGRRPSDVVFVAPPSTDKRSAGSAVVSSSSGSSDSDTPQWLMDKIGTWTSPTDQVDGAGKGIQYHLRVRSTAIGTLD